MGRHLAANALSLLIVLLVLVAGLIAWGQRQYAAPGPLTEAVAFEVPSGATFNATADRLKEAGIIGNAAVFRIGARYAGTDDGLKAGIYEIPAGASMEKIAVLLEEGSAVSSRYRVTYQAGLREVNLRFADLIDPVPEDADVADLIAKAEASGASIEYRVTVAEGLTSWRVVEALKEIGKLEGDIAAVPPEGALAPDTYDFRAGDSRQGLIDRMAEAQTRLLAEAWAARARDLPVATPEELLVLASIIEKETGVPEEREQVASVFVNRLRQGMKLETDPTVIYGITNGEGVLERGLRRSELRAETPYNTYVIAGLPPGPIANPGRASLMAAAQPGQTPFLFFVADGTGGHAFAETLADHNRNVEVWRRIEAQRGEEQRPVQGE
jgi:UPF0755 protein